MAEKISNIHETIIRRINRQFQITRKGNQIDAVLTLPVKREHNDQVQTETHNRFLTVKQTPNGFSATLYTKTFWKRSYWRRWREKQGNYVYLESTNFLRLSAAIKEHFE